MAPELLNLFFVIIEYFHVIPTIVPMINLIRPAQ